MAEDNVRAVPGRTRVAVALGGGGARGYAQIGILGVLEERGYDIVSIAGTSMGAVVGGLYSAGGLDAYSEWVCGLAHRDVLRLYDVSPRAPGAIRGERIFARVTDILGDVRIEDLPLPFTAVATDLMAGEEVWFQEGPVDAALRASAALPGFMTPVVINGRLLADGGLVNPLPIAPTVTADADLTVAVAVSGPQRTLADWSAAGQATRGQATESESAPTSCGEPPRTSSTATSSVPSGRAWRPCGDPGAPPRSRTTCRNRPSTRCLRDSASWTSWGCPWRPCGRRRCAERSPTISPTCSSRFPGRPAGRSTSTGPRP